MGLTETLLLDVWGATGSHRLSICYTYYSGGAQRVPGWGVEGEAWLGEAKGRRVTHKERV